MSEAAANDRDSQALKIPDLEWEMIGGGYMEQKLEPGTINSKCELGLLSSHPKTSLLAQPRLVKQASLTAHAMCEKFG